MSAPARSLGVIMLDTDFPRPPGDVGHPGSWDFPVKFRRVGGASPDRVIRRGGAGLLDDFIAAGESLVAEGCCAIITSCGFMALHQQRLADALTVPVAASSMVLLPLVEATLGAGRRAGVITYDGANLTPEMLSACGADPSTPVAGVPSNGAFHALIEGGAPYDRAGLDAEVISVACDLVARHPSVGAIVLECTNMPPFAAAIAQVCAMPVFDVLTLGRLLYSSTCPRHFIGME
jgi:hypothetical protein